MAALGKGDWVQLVDASWPADGGPVHLGGVYCVDLIYAEPTDPLGCPMCGDVTGLELVDVPRDPDWCWCPCQFKPLGGGERLTAPPARVCEPA